MLLPATHRINGLLEPAVDNALASSSSVCVVIDSKFSSVLGHFVVSPSPPIHEAAMIMHLILLIILILCIDLAAINTSKNC